MYKVFSRTLSRGNSTVLRWSVCSIRQKHNIEIENKNISHKLSFFTKYFFTVKVKYLGYLKKKFPKVYEVYKIFNTGCISVFTDSKKLISIISKQKQTGIDSLTYDELKLFYALPKELFRVAPLVMIGAIPFTNYIILPLAYKYPRKLLTSYYWSPQQKLEFRLLDHKEQLQHYKPLFTCMQNQIKYIRNPNLKRKWSDIMTTLNNGMHPSTSDILACIDLFIASPYSLSSLRKQHLKELLAIHGMSQSMPFKKLRLIKLCYMIHKMNGAIEREGGTGTMSSTALQWAVSLRGLNSVNMSDENMRNWLDQWITISKEVDQPSFSLLLHCPILLAYNHPNNRSLVPLDT